MSYSYVFTNKPLSKEFENSSENEKLLNGQKMNGHKTTFLSDQGFSGPLETTSCPRMVLSTVHPVDLTRRREKDEDSRTVYDGIRFRIIRGHYKSTD